MLAAPARELIHARDACLDDVPPCALYDYEKA
jgi:hypothetical protein